MKSGYLFTGIFSMVLSAVCWLQDKTRYVFIFDDEPLRRMTIYPAAFFGLLGLMLIYWSVKPLFTSESAR